MVTLFKYKGIFAIKALGKTRVIKRTVMTEKGLASETYRGFP